MLERATDLYKWDSDIKAVSYWMKVTGAAPAIPVRVIVTDEGLRAIDPNQVPDKYGAIATFQTNRQRIDEAASVKFDAGSTEAVTHEGHALVLLRATDLT
jgi:Protein of unknown function (DUF1488)